MWNTMKGFEHLAHDLFLVSLLFRAVHNNDYNSLHCFRFVYRQLLR